MGTVAFRERSLLKKRLNNRLKHDGFWDSYNTLRAFLKQDGVDESTAWLVAAFPFPPKDGSVAEIIDHSSYAEIAAGWENGLYKQPDLAASSEQSEGGDVEAALRQPSQRRAKWESLAVAVGHRVATELEESRWVMANYLTPVERIQVEDIPSTAALGILSWVQESSSNYGDFVRTDYTKLLPDKKQLEDHRARFYDDGRDLKLNREIRQQIEAEENAKVLVPTVASTTQLPQTTST